MDDIIKGIIGLVVTVLIIFGMWSVGSWIFDTIFNQNSWSLGHTDKNTNQWVIDQTGLTESQCHNALYSKSEVARNLMMYECGQDCKYEQQYDATICRTTFD